MSGIIGLLDPAGPDVGLVEKAAYAAAHRGRPVVQTAGPAALGVLVDGDEPTSIFDADGSLTVIDGRVDARLPGTPASRLDGSLNGHQLLVAVLRDLGPTGLSDLAADFAVARFDPESGRLTVARDVFGLRPLFWARRGARVGVASDVRSLVQMGLVEGQPDPDMVRQALFDRGQFGDRTVHEGVHRTMTGRAVEFRLECKPRVAQWFHPERIRPEPSLTLEEAAKQAREAILASTADRARGRRVALWLSSGRDSAAIAVALAEVGVRAECLTYVLEADGVPSEAPVAEKLARSLGHAWREVRIPPTLDPARVDELVHLAGGPVDGVGGPIQLAMHDAIREVGSDLVMSGEGGDMLFSAFPVGVVDLLARGRLRRAVSAARAFDRNWCYPLGVTAKVCLRAMTPAVILAARERYRPRAPWLIHPREIRVRTDRTDVAYLRNLMRNGTSWAAEIPERVFRLSGATLAWPLGDLRVVDVALRLPVELRIPDPAPKMVLQEAMLGDRANGLVKAPLGGFVSALTKHYRTRFADAFGNGSLAGKYGMIHMPGLRAASEPGWEWDVACLMGTEIWLRHHRERDGVIEEE